jgi:Na+-driven multidrug efflux pump
MVSQVFFEAWVASFSLVYRLEFFAYLPAVGFSMAAMSLIWQNMWAKKYQRANEVFKKACVLSFISATVLWILLILLWKYIIAAFTSDPLVTQYAISYLWIVAGTYGFLSISMVVSSTFQAMWKSWNGFWLLFMKMFIITLPLSYIFIFHYDFPILSVWGSLGLGSIILAIVGFVWNRRMFKKFLR